METKFIDVATQGIRALISFIHAGGYPLGEYCHFLDFVELIGLCIVSFCECG